MHSFWIILSFWFILTATLPAQEYRYEIGGAAGTSFYMGDANRNSLYKYPGIAGGLLMRYNISHHWAVKANILAGRVTGNSADSGNSFPYEADHAFSRIFAETGTQVEFNFLPYSDRQGFLETSRYTPYLLAGAGLTAASGDRLFLHMSIPIGAGVKYKIKNRMNIGIEFSMRKLFGDDFDVTRIDTEPDLEYPYGIRGSILKNRDWYSVTMIYMTWDFGLRRDPCCDN